MTTRDPHLTDAQAQRLVDGTLPPAEAPEVERHAAACLECRATVEAYRMLSAALEDLEVPPLPDDFTEGVLSRIDLHARQARRERRHAVAIFAVVVLASAAAFVAAGASAWAPVVSSAAERFGGAAHAFRIGAEFVPQVFGALRLQIVVAAAVLALPLLLAMARLMPSARAETA
jgi:anti-sigma factor RsiW